MTQWLTSHAGTEKRPARTAVIRNQCCGQLSRLVFPSPNVFRSDPLKICNDRIFKRLIVLESKKKFLHKPLYKILGKQCLGQADPFFIAVLLTSLHRKSTDFNIELWRYQQRKEVMSYTYWSLATKTPRSAMDVAYPNRVCRFLISVSGPKTIKSNLETKQLWWHESIGKVSIQRLSNVRLTNPFSGLFSLS